MTSATGGHAVICGYRLSGANTVAASDAEAVYYESSNAGDFIRMTYSTILTGLTPGSTTFEMQAKQFGGGTSTIERVNLSVRPL
jgi:hypothetical protein